MSKCWFEEYSSNPMITRVDLFDEMKRKNGDDFDFTINDWVVKTFASEVCSFHQKATGSFPLIIASLPVLLGELVPETI